MKFLAIAFKKNYFELAFILYMKQMSFNSPVFPTLSTSFDFYFLFRRNEEELVFSLCLALSEAVIFIKATNTGKEKKSFIKI